jgi:hypothetical protein
MAFPTNPTNGQTAIVGNIAYEYNSSWGTWSRQAGATNSITANYITASKTLTVTGNIGSHLIPSANVTYDIGTANRRWKDLYLSGQTIYLGDSIFTQANGSIVIIPPPTVEFPNPAGMVISPYGTISTVTTSNGNVTSSVTTSNISSFSNITVTNQATVGNVVATSYYYSNGSPVVPQGLSTISSPSFAGMTVNGNVTIAGNLIVDQIRAVTAVQISVQDPLLYLAANVLYPWTYDTGVYSHAIGGPANVYAHHGMVRSYSDSQWGFFSNVQSEPGLTINWSDAGLIWDKVKAGELVLANSTASTSTTTGALQVAGGIGVQGNAVVNAIYSDNYKFANGAAFSSSSTYGNTEVGAYLPIHSANVAASNVVVTGNVIQNGWRTYATASKLTIYYNSSPLFTIYTNGNIVAAGDVQAYGSP